MEKIIFALLRLMVFCIPWEEAIGLEGVGGVTRLVGYAALGMAFLSVAAAGVQRSFTRFHFVLLVFVFWNFASLLWTVDSEATLGQALTFARVAGMAWLLWEFASGPDQVRSILCAYVLGCYASIANLFIMFAQGIAISGLGSERYSGGGMDANDLALVLAIGIPWAYYLAFTASTKHWVWRWMNLLFGPIAVVAILLTGSRGGLIALFAGVISFILVVPGKADFKWRIFLSTVSALSLIMALYYVVPMITQERLLLTPEEIQFGTLSSRRLIWEAGIETALQNLTLGVGSGAFVAGVGPIFGKYRVAHNAYLSILTETGIIGLGLFLVLVTLATRATFRIPFQERSYWLASGASWAVGVFALTWEYRKPTWLLLALLINMGTQAVANAAARREMSSTHRAVPLSATSPSGSSGPQTGSSSTTISITSAPHTGNMASTITTPTPSSVTTGLCGSAAARSSSTRSRGTSPPTGM